ncbi:NADH dehydrogenase [ubiquinone] 1 beta subcomplex subunit 5, mitochondrial [Galendromus occidentalis]|uniref:NADH dehydrogenase [ubiquinone] 1 beta subcomplex subunit 5, mitochondrial n=1 Tax=Galendromus occidentalis TaxID=34638 RepID=A0AAJ6QPQ6_9ACAR|nr:NADH dehydrogenase [ubiquinone] 1 beta subcomplex subunit 5, mitochondrial [Galendromus occidentalis]XP_003739612.1 NADH dehydrogenase [ubiquinone] 1 beta subcomplex subunit 5, mitochondrial [Galendromus occidentalis]
MSILSRFRAAVKPTIALLSRREAQKQAVRGSHDRVMEIRPTSYHWKLFFDDMHFYLCLTGIPLFVAITSINIFIGPATLSDIPPGYEPEEHEYYRSPITRFIVKHFINTPQSIYEQNMASLQMGHEEEVKKECFRKVKTLLRKRGDYREFYFVPVNAELMTRAAFRGDEMRESMSHPDI